MKNNFIQVIAAAFGGLGAYLCGLNWEIILIWVILMALDIVTGVIKALKNTDFSSHDMKLGLLKKSGELALMVALILVQRVMAINDINIPAGTLLAGAFCVKEFSSIVENVVGTGSKMPELFKKWFRALKSQYDDADADEKKEA